MYLYDQLLQRADANRPVRVGLIGAGKFGSMFLSQVPTTPGLTVAAIADLRPDNARAACRSVGWPDELIAGTEFTDDAAAMMASGKVDVVVEATGNPIAGIRHAQKAIENGVHIVMVNVEADVLAGAALAARARSAGTVYSMAYG
ncbi:MAG: flagellar biosynthesis protein FlgA, partial [Proteobacteria bacterium]|nr:flagellar biosynthesis protein FlgA [Pseudomonadota bacterium]